MTRCLEGVSTAVPVEIGASSCYLLLMLRGPLLWVGVEEAPAPGPAEQVHVPGHMLGHIPGHMIGCREVTQRKYRESCSKISG